jgi:hypothetical protein
MLCYFSLTQGIAFQIKRKTLMIISNGLQKLTKVFCWGLVIRFLGSLPLGTMNIAATHIAIEQGTNAGLMYAVGLYAGRNSCCTCCIGISLPDAEAA